jgi:hypothetical protein
MTHITIERDKLEQVREALDNMRIADFSVENLVGWNKAMTAIKQALAAQPAPTVQEPVAWIWKYANGEEEVVFVPPRHVDASHVDAPSTITPLYTTPPAAQPAVQPVPLTDGVLKITMQLDGLEVSRLLSLDVIRTSNAPEVDRHSRQAWLDLQKAMPENWFAGMPEEYRKEAWRVATPPAAQPAIPDAITDNSESPEYRTGWNDYRAAMMEMKK